MKIRLLYGLIVLALGAIGAVMWRLRRSTVARRAQTIQRRPAVVRESVRFATPPAPERPPAEAETPAAPPIEPTETSTVETAEPPEPSVEGQVSAQAPAIEEIPGERPAEAARQRVTVSWRINRTQIAGLVVAVLIVVVAVVMLILPSLSVPSPTAPTTVASQSQPQPPAAKPAAPAPPLPKPEGPTVDMKIVRTIKLSGVDDASGFSGLAFDKQGRIYIADSGASVIRRFSRDGAFERNIGEKGETPGKLVRPVDVAIDGAGSVLTVDKSSGQIVQRFSADGAFQSVVIAGGGFYSPGSVAIASDGSLVISDTGSKRIVLATAGGKINKELRGNEAMLLGEPHAAIMGPNGVVFSVANERLVRIDSDGSIVASKPFGAAGASHLAIVTGPPPRMFVTIPNQRRMLVYDVSSLELVGQAYFAEGNIVPGAGLIYRENEGLALLDTANSAVHIVIVK